MIQKRFYLFTNSAMRSEFCSNAALCAYFKAGFAQLYNVLTRRPQRRRIFCTVWIANIICQIVSFTNTKWILRYYNTERKTSAHQDDFGKLWERYKFLWKILIFYSRSFPAMKINGRTCHFFIAVVFYKFSKLNRW